MAKVIPRILGGIGNQLFCYAAARRLALSNKAELVLDDVSGYARDFKYRHSFQLDHFNISARKADKRERLEPFPRLHRYMKRRLSQLQPFERRTYILQEGMDFDPRILNMRLRGETHIEGYWQSESYFKDIEEVIREDLRICPPTDARNRDLADEIQGSNAVAVHVRFFDAPGEDGTNNAPTRYYQKALSYLKERAPSSRYFIFSDNPLVAKAFLSLSSDQAIFVDHNRGDHNAYADLWLMSLCKHFVIANSTFSWWGAWLSAHADKQVIAPGFEKREGRTSWGFKGLLPPPWIRI